MWPLWGDSFYLCIVGGGLTYLQPERPAILEKLKCCDDHAVTSEIGNRSTKCGSCERVGAPAGANSALLVGSNDHYAVKNG